MLKYSSPEGETRPSQPGRVYARLLRKQRSIPASRLSGEILLEFSLDVAVLVGVRGRLFLGSYIGPRLRILAIELEPLLNSGLGIRFNRINRAFRLAHPAVDAFVGVDDE